MGSHFRPKYTRVTSLVSEGDDYSSIQPDNIPIPLGLPIVYFHDDADNLNEKRASNEES